MTMHPIVVQDPRWVELCARFDELKEQRAEHRRAVDGEQKRVATERKEYASRMARAMGDEERSEIPTPQPSALLEAAPDIVRTHLSRAEQLRHEEEQLKVTLAVELRDAVQARRRELQESAAALVAPILEEFGALVDELNILNATMDDLASAAWRAARGARGMSDPPPIAHRPIGLAEALESVLEVVRPGAPRKPRDLRPWWKKNPPAGASSPKGRVREKPATSTSPKSAGVQRPPWRRDESAEELA